eukprot:3693824-Rhodomonas_salina.1
MVLRACYAMPGTDIALAATSLTLVRGLRNIPDPAAETQVRRTPLNCESDSSKPEISRRVCTGNVFDFGGCANSGGVR